MRAAPGAGGCAAAILRRALRGKEKSFLRARATSGAGGGWGRPGVSRPRDPTGARRSRSCGNACARYRGPKLSLPSGAPPGVRLGAHVYGAASIAAASIAAAAGHDAFIGPGIAAGACALRWWVCQRSAAAVPAALPALARAHVAWLIEHVAMSHASWHMARGTGFRAGRHDRHHGRLRARERATRGERPYPKAFKTARRRAQHSSAHSARRATSL
jgi:hypothetical protein